MTSLHQASTAQHGEDQPEDGLERLERMSWKLFAAAAVAATALILWLGRGRSFSADELIWFMQAPDFDPSSALEPHVGHLILTTRLVYEAIYSTVGVDYLTFRVLTMATVVLTAGLFFVYAGRRIGRLAALAPSLILLIFGSDADHLLSGNGFTVVGALACGLGALLALDRDDRRGDVLACALLCLGIATYTVALAFVVGTAVSILLRDDRWRRAWIVVIPVAIYGAWWLWALGSSSSSESQVALTDVVLFPSWAFQSLSVALSALVGLDYPFGGSMPQLGPTLALAAIVGLGWRLWREPAPRMLWSALGIAGALWMMGAISRTLVRVPDSSRYLYPTAVVVLIVAAWAVAGMRWRRSALIALFLVAATGMATNIALARRAGETARIETMVVRADLAGIEIAGANAIRSYSPPDPPYPIAFSFGAARATGEYLAAADLYGSLGYSPEELRAAAEPIRVRADATLVGALGLALQPTNVGLDDQGCVELGAEPSGVPSVEVAPEQTVVLEADERANVEVRRFADASGAAMGTLEPNQAQALSFPADSLPDPWRVTSDAQARACVTR